MSRSALHEVYEILVRKGRLKPNLNQASLIDRLAQLQHQVSTTTSHRSHGLRGLYIHGSVGTGKSRLADLFAATLPAHVSKRRTHFHEFMLDIHNRMHHARSSPDYAGDPLMRIGREIALESRVLCFDEFQVSDIADAMILKRLFGAIWAAGGVMISTSNRHPSRLYENGLNRQYFLPFIADLERKSEIWKLQGEEDYRLSLTNDRDEVFFTERAAYEAALARATCGKPSHTLSVDIMMNRVLQIQGYPSQNGNVVVSSSFDDLFKRNLGAADYHALCGATTSIYVAGMRQFRSNELDFVRRFITLIDIAYESKTRINILSDTPLTEMFKNVAQGMEPVVQTSLSVRKEGGSSSSNSTTFIGDVEWSATGLMTASLATGGSGETDVRFAIVRAVSRLSEMGRRDYGAQD